MSHIPNSAMPHAGRIEDKPQDREQGRGALLRRGADRIRERPRAAMAAGAVLAAGLAAAALPFLRNPAGANRRRRRRRAKTA